jgi:hypothetical protein
VRGDGVDAAFDLAEEGANILIIEGQRPAEKGVEDDAATEEGGDKRKEKESALHGRCRCSRGLLLISYIPPDIALRSGIELARDDFRARVVRTAAAGFQEHAVLEAVAQAEVGDHQADGILGDKETEREK